MSQRPVTTARRAAMTQTLEAPEVVVPEVRQRNVKVLADIATYVTNMGRRAQFKIVAIAGDEDDIALTRAVLTHHPKGVLKFTNYRFSTPHVSVAQWIDKRIAAGILRGISRDTGDMKLRCEWCDYTVNNNESGRTDLARHRVDEHAKMIYGGSLFGEELDDVEPTLEVGQDAGEDAA